jgi:hypothetical protein
VAWRFTTPNVRYRKRLDVTGVTALLDVRAELHLFAALAEKERAALG